MTYEIRTMAARTYNDKSGVLHHPDCMITSHSEPSTIRRVMTVGLARKLLRLLFVGHNVALQFTYYGGNSGLDVSSFPSLRITRSF